MTADAVRYLSMHRNSEGRWASSYETAWITLALNKYMQASGELFGNFIFSWDLNGAALAHGQAAGPQNMAFVNASAGWSQLHPAGANSLVISK